MYPIQNRSLTVAQAVVCNGFAGRVTKMLGGECAGMVEVHLNSGFVVVSGTELLRFTPPNYGAVLNTFTFKPLERGGWAVVVRGKRKHLAEFGRNEYDKAVWFAAGLLDQQTVS